MVNQETWLRTAHFFSPVFYHKKCNLTHICRAFTMVGRDVLCGRGVLQHNARIITLFNCLRFQHKFYEVSVLKTVNLSLESIATCNIDCHYLNNKNFVNKTTVYVRRQKGILGPTQSHLKKDETSSEKDPKQIYTQERS